MVELGVMTIRTRGRTRQVWLGQKTSTSGNRACIDWRQAPLAEVFFGGTVGAPYEVEVGDRLLEGVLEDRGVLGPDGVPLPPSPRPDFAPWGAAGASASGLVTLDPAQQAAVQAPPGGAMLVLGAAGFGKTTVALHRAAHLVAQAGPRARGLVLVPNEGLRRLCAKTLALMGASRIDVGAFDPWALDAARRAFLDLPERDAVGAVAEVVHLKRHGALATVLDAVVHREGAGRSADWQDILHLFGDTALLDEVVDHSAGTLTRRAVQETAARTRVQFSETSEQTYAHVDADRLVTLDGARIDQGTPLEDAQAMDPEDAPVLFEIARRRGAPVGPTPYDVVVVDEAQELGPFELALAGRAVVAGGSLVVAGDDAQRLAPELGVEGWPEALSALGAPNAHVVRLDKSYRCPPEVARIAASVRAGEPAPRPSGPVHAARFVHRLALELALVKWLQALTEAARGAEACVIYRSADAARAAAGRLARGVPVRYVEGGEFTFGPGVTVTALDEVRGLEFDLVVLADASPQHYPDTPAGRRALYLGLTRAVRGLWVLGVGAPPTALRAWS